MTPYRAEIELLLLCATSEESPRLRSRAKELLGESLDRESLDWDYLLRLAAEHGVRPLLFRSLEENPDLVPKAQLESLREHFRQNNLRNLALTQELLQLVDAFEEREIPMIPYKGPLLTQAAYGNLALREFVDLDILVKKRDIFRAKDALFSMGHHQEDSLTPAQEAAYLHADCEYHFARSGADHFVELHWEISPRNFSFPFNDDSLWGRTRRFAFGGRNVLSFSPEDTLLVLCAHGCADFWRQLKQISDVAALLETHDRLRWTDLIARSEALGGKRMLFLGLALARDLLGAELPRKILLEVEKDAAVKTLADRVKNRIFRLDKTPGGDREEEALNTFYLGLKERPKDKARYLIRATTTPYEADRDLLPNLPAKLWPLYYAIKPARMVQEYRGLAPRRPKT